jgi:hypothetical protein
MCRFFFDFFEIKEEVKHAEETLQGKRRKGRKFDDWFEF